MSSITLDHSQLTQSCKDKTLISELKVAGKLNPDPNISYILQCQSGVNYNLNALLGTGSFNDVWSLKNNTNQVLRITKVGIEPDKLQNEITGLFLQSYMSKPVKNGGIGCDHICQVYEFGYVDKGTKSERVYAILESLPTTELYEKIYKLKNQNPKPYLNLSKTFHQILQGLNCIHSHGYAHLDMKTENVGLNADGNAKIFDFGYARFIPYTKEGYIKEKDWYGTPVNIDPFFYYYNNASLKSDVYSVGIMMIETYFDMAFGDGAMEITSPRFHSSERRWDIFKRICFDSVADRQNHISYDQHSSLIDLVKWMTYPHPNDRCNSNYAMKHSWFVDPVSRYQRFRNFLTKNYNNFIRSKQTANGGKKSRKIYRRKTEKKRRQSSFVKSRRSSRR